MSIFNLKNFTHYNTDDIQTLLDLVEGSVLDYEGCAEPVVRKRYGGSDIRIPLHIVLKEYAPKTLYEKKTTYNNAGRSHTVSDIRVYVKDTLHHTASNEVCIVSPEMLWDTPIEALAASSEHMPEAAVLALALRFKELFTTQCGTDIEWTLHRASLPPIRIEAKKSSRIDEAEHVRLVQARVFKSWFGVTHPMERVINYFEKANKIVGTGVRISQRSHVPLSPAQKAFVESVENLRKSINTVSTCLANMAQELNKNG